MMSLSLCVLVFCVFRWLSVVLVFVFLLLFFFIDPATTEIYTLSLQTLFRSPRKPYMATLCDGCCWQSSSNSQPMSGCGDRKSTRLNSSHGYISYAVFCLKKKNITRSVTSETHDIR